LERGEIESFVRNHHIDMSEFEPVNYRSFADFFDRRFRSDAHTHHHRRLLSELHNMRLPGTRPSAPEQTWRAAAYPGRSIDC
jgi:hypothetical protein